MNRAIYQLSALPARKHQRRRSGCPEFGSGPRVSRRFRGGRTRPPPHGFRAGPSERRSRPPSPVAGWRRSAEAPALTHFLDHDSQVGVLARTGARGHAPDPAEVRPQELRRCPRGRGRRDGRRRDRGPGRPDCGCQLLVDGGGRQCERLIGGPGGRTPAANPAFVLQPSADRPEVRMAEHVELRVLTPNDRVDRLERRMNSMYGQAGCTSCWVSCGSAIRLSSRRS